MKFGTLHAQSDALNGARGRVSSGLEQLLADARVIDQIARRLYGEINAVQSTGSELRFGTHGSLSVDLGKGTFFDYENNTGGGLLDLINHKIGGGHAEAFDWLRREGFLGNFDYERPNSAHSDHKGASERKNAKRRIVTTYDYTDEQGSLVFQVVRYEPKNFRQRRPEGSDWVWNLQGVRIVPYRLPELLDAIVSERTVFVVEGEKDADNLAKLNIVATCNAGGAGNWKAQHAAHLKGADVVIIPDNDDPGRHHAASVARSLKGIASRVRILELPGLAHKGDVSDWIATAGGTAERLLDLAGQAPEWQPAKTNRTTSRARTRLSQSENPSSNVTRHTDCDLAARFAERHADDLRYVGAWSKWLYYNAKVWKVEATHLARDLTKMLCQEAAAECEMRGMASSKTVAGVQTLAAADRRIAATVEQWDADPWLLNTPGGVVDLRTGKMREHRPGDHLTKITAVAPSDGCPLWLKFLDRIFGSDADLVAYVQRMLGYSLTGCTQEHAMFFGYGTGSNGKSVLLDTVAGIFGDYHATAPIETFTISAGDRHPTELARLVGARLVTAVETENGRRWAESRIKTLTGGDRVAARFMRQDFFEFKPQFKLVIAGNHKPVLRTVDEAIRRRFNMVPFAITIPAEERDLALTERLKAEWPGILQWMIEGCLHWQERGLCAPEAVTNATAKYLDAEDLVSAWIEECCETGDKVCDRSSALFASWKAYAERTGEEPGSMRGLGPMLEARGYTYKRTKEARLYQGLRVKPNEAPEPHWTHR
jgi:putative DNA primase/helicase